MRIKHHKIYGRFETTIYEVLGIKFFKKVILLFERIKHAKDGGKNENYHPHDTSCTTLRRFSGYLIFNSLFHAVSLLLVAIYFTVTRILLINNIVVDILMIVVAVFDIYCLMLQRYIYLRFQQHIAKKQLVHLNAKENRITDIISRLESKSANDIDKESSFLEGLKSKVLSGEDVVLSGDAEEILVNIADVLNENRNKERVRQCYVETLGDLFSKLPANTRVISTKQWCVSKLQRIMGFDKKDTVLFGVCIIAESATLNDAYRRIFPHSSLDSMLDTIEVLLTAYYRRQKEMMLL